jgi:2-oxoglutarate/2-oxoacid ferredoxin oxidoreductase subunit beta
LGFRGKSTPQGTKEYPLNPLELMLASGSSFVARGYPGREQHFKNLLKAAITHKGFSFLDVLQVCVTYNNLYSFYNDRVYEIEDNDPNDFDEALKAIKSWDYSNNADAKIPIGTFYEKDMPRFDESFVRYESMDLDRGSKIKEFLEKLT